jgi:hypothetical protein
MPAGPTLPAGYGRSKICKGLPVGRCAPRRFPFAARPARPARPAGREARGALGTRAWRQMCVLEVAAGSARLARAVGPSHSPSSGAKRGSDGGATVADDARAARAAGGDVRVAGEAGLPTGVALVSHHVRPLATTRGRAGHPRPKLPQWLPCVADGAHGATGLNASLGDAQILRTTGCLLGGCELQPGRRSRSDVDGKRRGNAHLDSQRECPRS